MTAYLPLQPAAAARAARATGLALGVSCVMTQLALFRELLEAFAGNELVLGVVMGNWLLLMGLGSALGRRADRLRAPTRGLAAALVGLAVIPWLQVAAARAGRHVVFPRGGALGLWETFGSSLVLLAPYCLVAGFGLALACAVSARANAAAGAGQVYVADSVGSIAGGALFTFVLARWLDHMALLAVPALLNLGVGGWLMSQAASAPAGVPWLDPARWEGWRLGVFLGLGGLALLAGADARTTAWQFPGQRVLWRAASPYGRVILTETGGQTNFIQNGLVVATAPNVEWAEEMAHYALAQRPEARRVLLVGGVATGVVDEVSKHPVAAVDCVELDPVLLATARERLPAAFADPRVRWHATDAREFLRRTPNRYDVILLALPDPATAQLNRYFTREFFAEARARLTDFGVLGFGLGEYHNFVSPELARLLATARATLRPGFSHVLLLPAGRVYVLASNGPLTAQVADRLEAARVATRLVKRAYLDAVLTPDRLAAVQQAAAQPARPNLDFHPRLYFAHLQHWLRQFDVRRSGWWLVPLLVVAGYAARLRAVGFAIFASGLAASALSVTLLLAVQVLCGSLYQQVGLVVTLFMSGLTLGALATHRRGGRPGPHGLTALVLGLAAYAALLPPALAGLSALTATQGTAFALAGVGMLSLGLGALVGAQFPVATRQQYDGTNRAAARMYTADFVGAFVGAGLAGAWWLPMLGVGGLSLGVAALNVLAGAALLTRKHSS